jgi:recombination protein RecT
MNAPSQQVILRAEMEKMTPQFKMALPEHVPPERFTRVALTAISADNKLLNADRLSLYAATMKCAQDGLMPDGREAALVVFGDKVAYMPMLAGILKKVRNSGELLSISAHVVYDADTFQYQLGDEEKIIHIPSLTPERGKPKMAYAIAKTKDGGIYREIMTVADIEKARAVSRAKNSGPWVDWWSEMARKTVLRRLSKRLPMNTDLDDVLRRDDELTDFDEPVKTPTEPKARTSRLQAVIDGELLEAETVPADEMPVINVDDVL